MNRRFRNTCEARRRQLRNNYFNYVRKGGRAVECTGLENQRTVTGSVGSNPTPSAT
jgi:hypothetical protein